MTATKEPVNIYFITGFLGSGKTTFLNHILTMLPAEKIGLIINEFGQLGVDGEAVDTGGRIPIREINNGQVFCGCVSGSFVETICEYLRLPIRHLIVETSGMANPHNIATILEAVARKAEEPYEYRGMICVADATRTLELAEAVNAVREQLAKSEYVIVNKVDLVDSLRLDQVMEGLRQLNPDAAFWATEFGRITEDQLLSFLNGKARAFTREVERLETEFVRPLNYLLETREPVKLDALLGFVHSALDVCYRIKGYASTGEGTVLVNGVGDQVQTRPVGRESAGVELILISSEGDIGERLNGLWEERLDVAVQIQEKGREYWD